MQISAEEVGRPMSEEEKVHVHGHVLVIRLKIIPLSKRSQSGICLVKM